MPPPGSGVPTLSIDERMLIARWIDLGAPINSGDGGATAYGWFLDEIRPTLEVSLPRPHLNPGPLDAIRVGVADAHGIAPGTLSVTASFAVAGRAAGQELADLAAPAGDGVYTIALAPPLTELAVAHVYARVADTQGNVTRVDRRFSVGEGPPPTTTTTTLPPAGACGPVSTGCAGAATSSVVLAAPGRSLGWKWLSAQALSAVDVGDPVSGAVGYRLCVYDGAGMLVSSAAVPAGGQCGALPCWRRLARGGIRYKDPKGTTDGIVGLTLRPGPPRRGRVGVRGKGARLTFPGLPIARGSGVTVELRRSDDPARCWSATFATSQRNGARMYRARLPRTSG